MNLTFASFLTPEGVLVAAALITTLIQVIKTAAPAIDAKVSGALQAFVISGVLYALTGAAVGIATADAGLTVFAAWLACAVAAMGIKSGADHVNEVQRGTAGDG